MTHPSSQQKREELRKSIINIAKQKAIMNGEDREWLAENLLPLVEQEIAEAEDRIFSTVLLDTSDITLRDYGGNERLVLQIITTEKVAETWARTKNGRTKAPSPTEGGRT